MKKFIISIFLLILLLIFFKSSDSLSINPISFNKVTLNNEFHQETLQVLKNYLKIKTIRNNEEKAALYFLDLFKKEKIDARIIKVEGHPGRSILLAQMGENVDSNKGIILAGHADVVEVNNSLWKSDPFAADEVGNKIYARGAIDMKTLSVLHFMSMVYLKRNNIKLNRKLMFLLVPGEEDGGLGADFLVKNHKDIFDGYEYLINEGAFFTSGIPKDGVTLANIQYAEKGIFWFMAKSKGKSSHGSIPSNDYAALKLINFINEAKSHFNQRIIIKSVQTSLHQISKTMSGFSSFVLKRSNQIWAQKLLESTLKKSKQLNAMTQNTFSITGLNTSQSLGMNVIGENADLKVDMRILPGTRISEVEKTIRKLAKKHDIEIFIVQKNPATESDIENQFFNSMAFIAENSIEGIVANPLMSYGATDNFHFRSIGLKCYGFFPIVLNSQELLLMHSDNEYISLENLKSGTQMMANLVNYWVSADFK